MLDRKVGRPGALEDAGGHPAADLPELPLVRADSGHHARHRHQVLVADQDRKLLRDRGASDLVRRAPQQRFLQDEDRVRVGPAEPPERRDGGGLVADRPRDEGHAGRGGDLLKIRHLDAVGGKPGSKRTARRLSSGSTWRKAASRRRLASASALATPVRLPPGASLETTSFAATGSATGQKTTGIVVVAARAAWVEGPKTVTIALTPASSAAPIAAFASSPERAFRMSIRMRGASARPADWSPSDTPPRSAP